VIHTAPRPLQLLPFSPDLQFTADAVGRIEAAYYSRDIRERTEKRALSPAAQAFWNIIDRASGLKWMAVYSAGMDQKRYVDVFDTEPLPQDSPFWDLPHVLISPHNAGASTGTSARGVEIFPRNLANYLSLRPLENEVSIL
jgi:D-isomer specific 2-hydroxyacid dehydrogenase, NAD binding domain